jgi:mannose-6-phosphate isomerase-like protein (cupin superfamily)
MSESIAETKSTTTLYRRVVGHGIDMNVDEVNENVALYQDLKVDPNAFVDKTTGERLPIKWVISPGNKAAPAGISTPHGLHIAFIESSAGSSPVIHSHEYREIFMPIKGRYRIYFNRNSENYVELGPQDTFSVPPHLWRRVEQVGEKGAKGMMMVIYDNVVDPNKGIFVPPEVVEADQARGLDPYAQQ